MDQYVAVYGKVRAPSVYQVKNSPVGEFFTWYTIRGSNDVVRVRKR